MRPSDEFGTDWEVIDRRNGQVIAVKYEPRSPDYPDDDPPMSALGAAEHLAAELNSALPGCGYCITCGYGGDRSDQCLHGPSYEELLDMAVALRIGGVTA